MEGKQTIVPRVGGTADRDVPTCRLDEKIGDIKLRLGDSSICVVVNERNIVLGLLTQEALSEDSDQTAEAAMESSPQTFRPNVPVKQAAKQMTRSKLDHALVTTSDGELMGALYRERLEEREEPTEAVEALAAGGL